MYLEQIYKRLDLFKDYLKYRLEFAFNEPYLTLDLGALSLISPELILQRFQETGYLFFNATEAHGPEIKLYEFDEWLFENKMYDCIDFTILKEDYEPKGLIDYIQKAGTIIEYSFPPSDKMIAKRKYNYFNYEQRKTTNYGS